MQLLLLRVLLIMPMLLKLYLKVLKMNKTWNCLSRSSYLKLDEKLVLSLDNYMESLGVTDELLHHIINYGIYKENEEYLRWLSNLEKFLK